MPTTSDTATLEALTEASERQIQLWSEQHLLRPAMRSRRLLFSEADALTAAITFKLGQIQINPTTAAAAVQRAVREILRSDWWRFAPLRHPDRPSPEAPLLLVYIYAGKQKWKARQIVVTRRADAIQAISKHPGPGHIVDLPQIAERIRKYYRAA